MAQGLLVVALLRSTLRHQIIPLNQFIANGREMTKHMLDSKDVLFV
jgi:hypothetical protein